MSTLFMESGFVSLNKQGEFLCGDYFTTVNDEMSNTFVLSDGMGSGVKANILATLTAKMLATMSANNLTIEDCVQTIAQTLPICSERKLAYSTFTLMRVDAQNTVYLAQYDNPEAVLIRNGKNFDYEKKHILAGEKGIIESTFTMLGGDIFILISDGVTHAGLGKLYPDGWQREGLIEYLEDLNLKDISAKNIAAQVAGACRDLYVDSVDDDVTVAVFKMRERNVLNLLVGPPMNPKDDERFMRSFFGKTGVHVVCGGSTAQMVSRYLHREIQIPDDYIDPNIPPIGKIQGVELVTEGIITLSRVLELAQHYASAKTMPLHWESQTDAATQIARALLEQATDINFFVGRAINISHQMPELHIDFSLKMSIIEKLESLLLKMGKCVRVETC